MPLVNNSSDEPLSLQDMYILYNFETSSASLSFIDFANVI